MPDSRLTTNEWLRGPAGRKWLADGPEAALRAWADRLAEFTGWPDADRQRAMLDPAIAARDSEV